MQPIQLSYILPMYNVQGFLDTCLHSLVNQGLARGTFEIILVNDGSKDQTLAVAERWARAWPEIKIIDQKNGGQAVARNAGMRLATGEYLWFIDSDDFILDGVVPTLLKAAKEAQVDVLTFELCQLPVGTPPAAKFNPHLQAEPAVNGIKFIEKHNYNNGPWLFIARKAFLQEIGLVYKEGRRCEDGMFTMETLCRVSRVTHSPSPAYVYVRHAASITKSRDPEIYRWWLEGFAHAIEFFNGLIAEQELNPLATPGFLRRLKSRRDSYTMFYCLRLLQSTQTLGEIIGTHRELRAKKWIPLNDLSLQEYPGLKWRGLRYLVGHTWIFVPAVLTLKAWRSVRAAVSRS